MDSWIGSCLAAAVEGGSARAPINAGEHVRGHVLQAGGDASGTPSGAGHVPVLGAVQH